MLSKCRLHPVLLLLVALLQLAGCEIQPPTGFDLAGLVVEVRTADGAPVSGVRVEVLAEGDTVPASQVTGIGGNLTMIGITPGVYHVGVRQPPTGYAVPNTHPNPVRVVVAPGKETRVRFTLVRR